MSEQKRAAIITLVGRFNYGNRLQNYAVDYLLKSKGFEVETIIFPLTIKEKIKRIIKKILKMPMGPESNMPILRSNRFLKFDSRMKQTHSHQRQVPKDYDVYVVGSDQIWNPAFYPSGDIAFLLDVPRSKRIALCPSFGVSSLSNEDVNIVKEGLLGFPRLSVREDSGAALIKSLTSQIATVLVDPTIAVPVDRWKTIVCNDVTPKEKYIFVYGLGEKTAEEKEAIRMVKELTGTEKVIYLSDRSCEGEVDAGPEEFLSLIASAEYVVTNSFHGAVFSILFQTPFVVFGRVEQENTSSRIATLLNTFDLENRLFNSDLFDVSKCEDYKALDIAIEEKRKIFDAYLDEEIERAITGSR